MTSGIVARLRDAGCVFAEDEARLLVAAAHDAAHLESLVTRRVAGVPLEPLIGWVEFCGLHIAIDPGVFVPRRRTQFLAAAAARLARPGAVVVDLCCGAGAVGAALLAGEPSLELYACDIDRTAVRCARRNLAGRVYEGDLFAALPDRLRGRADVLVANAPYVPTAEIAMMPPEARDHEPAVALDGGRDGVDVHRRIAAEAPRWLAPTGHLLVETSRRQADVTAQAMRRAGLTTRIEHDDEVDATVVIGTA
ncbi:MAG: putative protein N(5)-glutamine methyltransferase [Jatrophihabitans sp.]